jgi:hypothetical protein
MICICGSEATGASWRADVAEASATSAMALSPGGAGSGPAGIYSLLLLW